MTIIKDRDPKPENNSLEAAGARAEREFAFLLKREFGLRPDVMVLNDIRFMDDQGIATQIDHLVISRWAAFIVESKSVSSAVRINRQGEWERLWNGAWTGMPSPVAQVEMQLHALRQLLRQHASSLLGKMVGMQKGFGFYAIEPFVSISVQGSIRRDTGVETPKVLKADQLALALAARLNEVRRNNTGLKGFTGSKDLVHVLTEKEAETTGQFLVDIHRYYSTREAAQAVQQAPTRSASRTPATVGSETSAGATCKSCRGTSLAITYGKFGYYFKCPACDSNTKIALPPGGKLRKSGDHFYLVTESGETLFHVNA